jgi:site-specific recombinase XerD
MRDVTLTSLQLLLNRLAEDRFSKSVLGQIRTYVKSCFEYAVDEDLIPKSPARKLVMPKIRMRGLTSRRTRLCQPERARFHRKST